MIARLLTLLLLFSLIITQEALYPLVESLQDKKFYIYPFPVERWYAFPKCTMFEQYRENAGFGRILDKDKGFFNSWHHSLFYSLFMRLKYSKRRTMNPAEADLFIIPYDFATLERYEEEKVTNEDGSSYYKCRQRKKSYGCPQTSKELLEFLESSKYFWRYGGADHVMIFSLSTPFQDCVKIKKRICKLCISTGKFAYPPVLKPKKDFEQDMSSFVSLPYPSYYHWHDNVKFIPWSENRISERVVLASYAGNANVMIPDHTRLRLILMKQCRLANNPEVCTVVNMEAKKRSNSSHKSILAVRGQLMDVEPSDPTVIIRAYAKSVFCFVPPGDDPTRRAIVDIIITGCIPVLFNPLTLHSQYPFHLDEATAKAVSVFIPLRSIFTRRPNRVLINVIDVLRDIPLSIIREKQKQLALLAPRIVYAAPPLYLLRGLSNLADDVRQDFSHVVLPNRWDPPFSDAASLALDGMFSRAEHIKKGLPVLIPEKNISREQWDIIYNATIIR